MQLPRRLIRRAGSVPRVLVPARRRQTRSPFDLFTDHARNALSLAQAEAKRLGHDYIGIEHLLLGIIRERGSQGGRMLHGLGVSLGAVRSEVESIVGRGRERATGEMRLSPRAKRALKYATTEARSLRRDVVGTEHLLLGIVR